jgi:ABC-type polysaccharide/polyol phosphate transport system ATPase subunit
VVLVSHNDTTISSLCDRVIWLEHGRTVMMGSTADVMAAYRSAGAQAQDPAFADPGDSLVATD